MPNIMCSYGGCLEGAAILATECSNGLDLLYMVIVFRSRIHVRFLASHTVNLSHPL